MPNEIHIEELPLEVIFVNGKYYLLADRDLRAQVEDWSASGSLEEYIPNDISTWAPDTFYQKIDNNYILLTEMPSDWAQNYTSYYKKNEEYNPDGFVSASTILAKFNILDASKLDKSTYETLLATLQEKRIAFTASYNDLVDVPSFGGARVSGTTLIFSGSSSGQEAYLLEQLDLTAGVIGTGVL